MTDTKPELEAKLALKTAECEEVIRRCIDAESKLTLQSIKEVKK